MNDISEITLKDNANMREFIQILKYNKMNNFLNDFIDTLDYVGNLENKLDKLMGEIETLKEQMTKMRENPIKKAVSNTINNIENKLRETVRFLGSIKNNITQNVNQALNNIKRKGISAINSTLNFMRIKDGLRKIQRTLNAAENKIDKAVKELESLDKQVQKSSIISDLKAKKEQCNTKNSVNKVKKNEIAI